MAAKNWDEFNNSWKDLQATYADLRVKQKSVQALEERCRTVTSQHKKKLEEWIQSVDKDEKTKANLNAMKRDLSMMQDNLPKDQPLMLRAMVGRINVTLSDFKEKKAYKDRYENFKRNMTIIIMTLSLISIFLVEYRLPVTVLNVLGTWYYFSLILRENILQQNGSRIRKWWTAHHYFSALIAVVFLTWPRGECYNAFQLQFLLFYFYLSFVMLLQYLYQKGLLYKLVALGQAHPMSVTADGVERKAVGGLYFLVPFLLLVYMYQLVNSLRLLHLYFFVPCSHWQVLLLSVLFSTVAIGNGYTLFVTVYAKRSKDVKSK